MNAGKVASRYAKAIYEFALEKGQEKVIYKNFTRLANSFFKVPDLNLALKDPTISYEQKLKVLLTACGDAKNETLIRILQLILKNGRENQMQNIAMVYEEYYRNAKGIVIARLTTVEPASEKVKKELTDVIGGITKNEVEFHTETNPEIIGGFVLEIGDQRLDASVKDQLNRMRLDLID